jgi:hypothetical protein
MGVYVPNFNTMELANFLEKNQRLQLEALQKLHEK